MPEKRWTTKPQSLAELRQMEANAIAQMLHPSRDGGHPNMNVSLGCCLVIRSLRCVRVSYTVGGHTFNDADTLNIASGTKEIGGNYQKSPPEDHVQLIFTLSAL